MNLRKLIGINIGSRFGDGYKYIVLYSIQSINQFNQYIYIFIYIHIYIIYLHYIQHTSLDGLHDYGLSEIENMKRGETGMKGRS